MSLTAFERETIVNQSDGDDHVVVWTAQRSVFNRLRAKPDAEVIDHGEIDGSEYFVFKIPADRWNIAGAVKRRSTMTDEQKKAAAERLAEARKSKEEN